MKKFKWKKNLGIVGAFLAATILFNQATANADVTDNLQSTISHIIGHVNDIGTTFEKSSTNGKLNQMKIDLDAVGNSMDQFIAPYISNLTVWVDDSNAAYNGLQVSIMDSKGQKRQASYVARNGHYEADFSNILKGSYTITYPYIIAGNASSFSIPATICAGNNRKQLLGNIFQMSMSDIQAMCKVRMISKMAHVGDTISDGTYTYTIIGINQDKPSDANGNLLPSNSYGDVLTVMAMGAAVGASKGQPVTMNTSATPWGLSKEKMNTEYIDGWASSRMKNTTMPQYLAKLPQATQNVVGYVKKITGTYNGSNTGGKNSITGDKCFLLSGKEIFGGNGAGNGSYCTTNEAAETFQYQYFSNIATSEQSRNFDNDRQIWLRSLFYNYQYGFMVNSRGHCDSMCYNSRTDFNDVFPAFCIY